MGWKAVYENQSEDEEEEELKRQNLPVMQKGQEFSIFDIRLTEGKTKPPARFTEGTLIAGHGKSGTLYGKWQQRNGEDTGRNRWTWNGCYQGRYY